MAKKNSQDPGSAANGGALGLISRGMMVKPFDSAVFALKAGEISGLVKSDFGYHIIKLTAIKPSETTPFAQVSAIITDKLRQQKATDFFAELADKFSNTVYEQSDTLQPAATLAGVKVEQSKWIDKGMSGDDIWTAKMQQALFSDDVIKNHRNTAAVEIAPNTLVAARMLEHKPAGVRSLALVSNVIKEKLLHKKALDMAIKQGTMLLGQTQQGSKVALDWSAAQTITHAKHGELDDVLVRKLFQADSTKLPQYVGVEAPLSGYTIVRIDEVKNTDKPDQFKLAGYSQQLQKMTGEALFNAYMANAKKTAKIKLNLPEQAGDTKVKP